MDPIEASTLLARAAVEMTAVAQRGQSVGAARMTEYRDRRVALGLPRVFPADELRPKLMVRDGDRCIYCESRGPYVVDHIHPIALGGDDDLGNLGFACRPCNGRKAGRALEHNGMKILVDSARHAHEDYKSRTLFTQPTPAHSSLNPRTTAHNHAQVHIPQNASLSKKESKKKENKKEREVTRASQIPDGWLPDEMVWKAAVDHIGLDRCNAEFTKFKNHAADKGRVSKNWNSAWRNWVDRAIEYGASNGHRTGNTRASGSDAILAAATRAARKIVGDGPMAGPAHETEFSWGNGTQSRATDGFGEPSAGFAAPDERRASAGGGVLEGEIIPPDKASNGIPFGGKPIGHRH